MQNSVYLFRTLKKVDCTKKLHYRILKGLVQFFKNAKIALTALKNKTTRNYMFLLRRFSAVLKNVKITPTTLNIRTPIYRRPFMCLVQWCNTYI